MAAAKNPKPGPGRTPGFKTPPQTIKYIKTQMLLARLHSYVEGEVYASGPKKGLPKVTLEPGQVTAALGLLKKAVPDLSSVELKGDAEQPLHIITRAE